MKKILISLILFSVLSLAATAQQPQFPVTMEVQTRTTMILDLTELPIPDIGHVNFSQDMFDPTSAENIVDILRYFRITLSEKTVYEVWGDAEPVETYEDTDLLVLIAENDEGLEYVYTAELQVREHTPDGDRVYEGTRTFKWSGTLEFSEDTRKVLELLDNMKK